MVPLVLLSLAGPHSALLNVVFTSTEIIDGIVLAGGKPERALILLHDI